MRAAPRPRSWVRAAVGGALLAVIALLLTGYAAAQGEQSPPQIGYVEGRIVQLVPSAAEAERALVQLNGGQVVEAVVPGAGPFESVELPDYRSGQRVELYFSPSPGGGTEYVLVDWVRRPALLALVALFFVVSVAVARFKGLRAFVATAVSLTIVIGFIVPRILDGWNPVLVSLLGVGGILILAIYFVHGVSWSTTAALIGTFVAVVVTMVLGIAFSELAHLTGFGTEDAMLISSAAPQVALKGLLLAALLIGALGALTDITIVQAAVVRELAHVNPEFGLAELYRRAMNVGLDHIGSLVNTLVLAYTGAGLSLFILLSVNQVPLARAFNLELVAAEVIHTLVGSIGLVLAVPVTTLIAGAMFRGDKLPLGAGELDHTHHH